MSHKRRRQKIKFQDCGHTGFGKYCHFCKQIAAGKAKPRAAKPSESEQAAAAATGTQLAGEQPKKYWQRAKCPYCGGNRVRKNDINVFSDNNAKEYRCTSYECGKEFNSEQVKEYEKVEAVERPKVPYNPRLTD